MTYFIIAVLSFLLSIPIGFIFNTSFPVSMLLGFMVLWVYGIYKTEQFNQEVYERNKKRGFIK